VTTVLIVLPTGTYRAEEYLAAARSLGLEVVTGSERAQALSETMGSHFVLLPLDDPAGTAEAIVAHAERVPLDAVVAVDDSGSVGAAIAGERLGLRHNPPSAVLTTRDKVAMRRAFTAAGLPQPEFEVALNDGDVVEAAGRVGFPVVVKPPSLSASRGVIRADSAEQALLAARWIRRILAGAGEPDDSPLLVERFVAGGEVAVEGILRGGRLDVIAIFDKPDPLDGPYFEETLYVAPSRLPAEVLDEIRSVTAAAVEAIGLREGPVHAEMRIPPAQGQRPVVSLLEVAARTIGGRCSKAMALRGGSLEELVLASAAGIRGPEPVLERAAGVLMIPIPRSGRLLAVRGVEAARDVPGVTGVEISVARGRFVRASPEAERYLGFVFAAGETPAEVETALRLAQGLLHVEVSDAEATAGTVG
jgi:biotin carboxylase